MAKHIGTDGASTQTVRVDPTDGEIGAALSFDPLAYAERVTGKSYKESEDTQSLGFGLHIEHGQRRRRMLEAVDDVPFGCDLPNFLRIVRAEGFETVLDEPFPYQFDANSERTTEHYCVMWKASEGILLAFDSYSNNTTVNAGKFFYNWKPRGSDYPVGLMSSGHWRGNHNERDFSKLVLVGDHDCREALRFHIRQLRENGAFLPIWEECAFPWLLHFHDHHRHGDEPFTTFQKRAHELTLARLAKMPSAVVAAVKYGEAK